MGLVLFHLSASKGNPLAIKKKINHSIAEIRTEMGLVVEGSTWGMASLHPQLQALIAKSTKFVGRS